MITNFLGIVASCLPLRAQYLWATPKGLAVFNPNAMVPNSITPAPVFRSLVFGQDESGYNELNVSYAALSFSNERKIQYKSRILGYSEWTEPTSDNRLRLMNLPALFSKTYILEVLAANDSGLWSEKPLQHVFTVKPAWWLRWYTLGLAVLIVIIVVLTLRRQKLEAISERDKAERYAAEADAKSRSSRKRSTSSMKSTSIENVCRRRTPSSKKRIKRQHVS